MASFTSLNKTFSDTITGSTFTILRQNDLDLDIYDADGAIVPDVVGLVMTVASDDRASEISSNYKQPQPLIFTLTLHGTVTSLTFKNGTTSAVPSPNGDGFTLKNISLEEVFETLTIA